MIYLDAVVTALDEFFVIERFPDEPERLCRPSSRPIHRLGLALEPGPGLAEWVQEQQIDALFLHRPWSDARLPIPDDVGIISYHLPFDERLALGYNPRLAVALGMTDTEVLGRKHGHALGMIGNVRVRHVAEYFRVVRDVFGGYEEAHTPEQFSVTRVAVVGAMNKTLVHLAASRGADVYITGQYRQQGRIGVLETGIGVVIVGHARSEVWGLRALAGVLRERWAGLEVILAPGFYAK